MSDLAFSHSTLNLLITPSSPPSLEPYTMDIRTSRPNRPGPDLRIQGLSTGRRRGPRCAPFAPVFGGLVVQTYLHTMNDFVLCILSLCATYVAHARATYPALVSARAAHRADEREVNLYSSIGAPVGAYITNIPFWKVRSVPSVARPARGRR